MGSRILVIIRRRPFFDQLEVWVRAVVGHLLCSCSSGSNFNPKQTIQIETPFCFLASPELERRHGGPKDQRSSSSGIKLSQQQGQKQGLSALPLLVFSKRADGAKRASAQP